MRVVFVKTTASGIFESENLEKKSLLNVQLKSSCFHIFDLWKKIKTTSLSFL